MKQVGLFLVLVVTAFLSQGCSSAAKRTSTADSTTPVAASGRTWTVSGQPSSSCTTCTEQTVAPTEDSVAKAEQEALAAKLANDKRQAELASKAKDPYLK